MAFDYRHLGESGGEPRQIAPAGEPCLRALCYATAEHIDIAKG